MDAAVLEQMLDEIFDQAVVHHGYTTYMRDYEVIVYATAGAGTGIPPSYLRYLFRYCVEARCETSVSAEIWRGSLDDRLIDHETGVDLDGYVWGVKWHCLLPGRRGPPRVGGDATLVRGARDRLPRGPHGNQRAQSDLDLLRP